jgi:hypothetical protein
MTARNNASLIAAELSKDTGFQRVTIDIDPTQWSTRRRNIIVRALQNGITQCGYETGYFIKCLTEAYGASVQTMTGWQKDIQAHCVAEDKWDELMAYTCAWVRLALAGFEKNNWDQENYWYKDTLRNWIRQVEDGIRPSTIPSPNIGSPSEKANFIQKYLRKDDTELEFRDALIRKIERGEMLSISMNAR